MRVGRRVVTGAAHIGGVVVVRGHETIIDVLDPVYRALALAWDPGTCGDLAYQLPGITLGQVAAAILEQFRLRFTMTESPIDPNLLEEARSLIPDSRRPAS